MRLYWITLACFCVLGISVWTRAQTDTPPRLIPSPPSIWKAGDGWPVIVEYYPPPTKSAGTGKKSTPERHTSPKRYEMHIVITKLEPATKPIWSVDFMVPRKDAPVAVGQRAKLTLRKEDGAILSAFRYHFKGTIQKLDFTSTISKIEDIDVIADPPEGFPVDVFFAPMDYNQAEFVDTNARLTLKKEQDENQITLEATYKPAKGEELRVRQTWMQGEKWWRAFERYRGERKELRAWIPEDYFIGRKKAERRKAGDPAQQSATRPTPISQPVTSTREDERELHDDPRLRVPLNLELSKSTVAQVLQHLRSATKVDLTLDPGVDAETVAFGSLIVRSVPAWQVMMRLATCPAISGRWEKSETGYRLFGAPQPPEPARPIGRWVLSGVLATFLLGVSSWLVVRSLRKKAA